MLYVVALAGCRGATGHGLVIAGSTSVQPVMEKIIEAYRRLHPGERIAVEGGGSGAGIMAALTGTAHLGMSSRELKKNDPNEMKLTPIHLADDAIVIVVNRDNPVASLSVKQLRDVFAGKTRNWKELGGRDHGIHLAVREEGSGTRSAFDELVMKEGKTEHPVDPYALVQDSTGGLRELVRGDPDAIGFISLGAVNDDVRVVSVEGVVPTVTSVRLREYKLVRPFLLVSMGTPSEAISRLIAFAQSASGSEIMAHEGVVGVGH